MHARWLDMILYKSTGQKDAGHPRRMEDCFYWELDTFPLIPRSLKKELSPQRTISVISLLSNSTAYFKN
jgi:hypothetical protein